MVLHVSGQWKFPGDEIAENAVDGAPAPIISTIRAKSLAMVHYQYFLLLRRERKYLVWIGGLPTMRSLE